MAELLDDLLDALDDDDEQEQSRAQEGKAKSGRVEVKTVISGKRVQRAAKRSHRTKQFKRGEAENGRAGSNDRAASSGLFFGASKNSKVTAAPNPIEVDPWSGIRIKKRTVPGAFVDGQMSGKTFVKLGSLKSFLVVRRAASDPMPGAQLVWWRASPPLATQKMDQSIFRLL